MMENRSGMKVEEFTPDHKHQGCFRAVICGQAVISRDIDTLPLDVGLRHFTRSPRLTFDATFSSE